MIDGIRRRLLRSDVDEFDWDVNSQLEVEENESSVLLMETTVQDLPVSEAYDATNKTIMGNSEYYHRFILACIESGGKFGDHTISMGWLKTTLAGLEGRSMGTTLLWEKESEDDEETEQKPTVREGGYEDLLRTQGAQSPIDVP